MQNIWQKFSSVVWTTFLEKFKKVVGDLTKFLASSLSQEHLGIDH